MFEVGWAVVSLGVSKKNIPAKLNKPAPYLGQVSTRIAGQLKEEENFQQLALLNHSRRTRFGWLPLSLRAGPSFPRIIHRFDSQAIFSARRQGSGHPQVEVNPKIRGGAATTVGQTEARKKAAKGGRSHSNISVLWATHPWYSAGSWPPEIDVTSVFLTLPEPHRVQDGSLISASYRLSEETWALDPSPTQLSQRHWRNGPQDRQVLSLYVRSNFWRFNWSCCAELTQVLSPTWWALGPPVKSPPGW